jgi:hypothetical protein
MKTPLCELFEKYGADKCPAIHHSYSPMYFKILSPYRESFTNVLEIGIGTSKLMQRYLPKNKKYIIGASIRSWEEFFPQANIYGIDIEKHTLFEEGRIKCFYTDQSNVEELENTITEIKKHSGLFDQKFDLILDDGSHIMEHMLTTFNTLHKYIKVGGFYIIEDIKKVNLKIFTALENNEFKLIYVHEGTYHGDNFVAFQKTK